MMRMQLKITICDDNGRFMGQGPYKLLCLVEQRGSLRQAALEMGMSYSKAHTLIKRLEASLQRQVLCSHAGGASGGGARLTDFGRLLMQEYAVLEKRMNEAAAEAFAKFGAHLEFASAASAEEAEASPSCPGVKAEGEAV